MFKVSLYLDKRKPSIKNGNSFPVKLVIYDSKSQSQKQISTGEYQKSKKLRLSPELNKKLKTYQEREAYSNEHILSFEEAVNVIKNGFVGDDMAQIELLKKRIAILEKRQMVNFEGFTNGLIEEKRLVGKSTRHFEEAVAQIKNFRSEKAIDINDITYGFLKQFESFKRRTGTGNGSGIKKTVRTLRTIYKEAKRRDKIHDLSVDPFDGLDIRVERKQRNEIWDINDLKKLFNFEPKESTSKASKANMQRVIDIFLFQIAIGGHDLADMANLKWKDLQEGRISFQRFKLRSHSSRIQVNNIISPFAQMILDKYGTKEDERIFSFYADPITEKYRQQNGYQLKTLNRVIKTLNIPKLTTKSPRYIFRSLGGQLGVNELLLNQIMAHKPNSVSHRYQQDLSLEAQDEAHKKVLGLLFE